MCKIYYTFLIIASSFIASHANAAKFPANGAEFLTTCRTATAMTEKQLRLPTRLLNAISLAETGRWHDKNREIVAWPWTVYSEGRGRYLPSKAAAIAEVRKLQAKGVKNIDVGCMQVNLHWHPKAFKSLEEAFDPTANTSYAGNLLKKLRNESKSWNFAVAYYHSRTKKYYVPYKAKVIRLWKEDRKRDTLVRLEKARAKHRAQRAALKKKREDAKKKRVARIEKIANG
ncbi:MAG: transglycosylase SLT domain-containing protein [Sneathiella sp.]|nr:transglycosylase SLT domain-containing protein [Sneathiella sp.]